MSKVIRAIAVGLVLSIAISFFSFSGKCDRIREQVLRLHVMANSDSQEDQALKLKVRDAVIEAAAGMVDTAANEADAEQCVRERLPEIVQAAQQCVWDEGYDYNINAELCEMYFATRRYEAEPAVTLPAGVYNALRVTIGTAGGKNWWCVVFPPMCVSAATDAAALDDVLDDGQRDIVTSEGKYEVRFKVVEVFSGISNKFSEWFGKD